jgi:hypothetical protein
MADVLRKGLTLTEAELATQYTAEAEAQGHETTRREAVAYSKQVIDLIVNLGLALVDGNKFKYNVTTTTPHTTQAQERAMAARPALLGFPGGGTMYLMPGASYQLVYDEEMDILIKPLT